ncbi:GPW/gp25 family protein [Novosphingobium sp. P6W]|uniref:GPW/gp25 family protein n=1 Tax=Novosphingobium sp. P6W TaxID=1609758 RepID=UPI0005C2FF90|nr:GPW/gp25 family protein [Novosphingobium sp. P6W]AXB75464.1 oxidoreductase [Novosphingobium sp. P6W]KIS32509.1 oxidoreductase [Novosphingobium sp. P6W]
MTGMSRTTGATIDGLESIRESVADILSTPIGARTCREDYGSALPGLIDQPMTATNIMRIFAATAVAVTRWEDRIRLRRVSLTAGDRQGAAILIIDADRTDTNAANARTRLAIPL